MRLMPWLQMIFQRSLISKFPGRRLAAKRRRGSMGAGLERLEGRILMAADGDFGLAFDLPGADLSAGTAIATDASGNFYVAGGYYGTADFDPGAGVTELTSPGGPDTSDSFVAKYTPDGTLIWARQISGGESRINALAVDDEGGIYATGLYAGTVDFDPGVGTQDRTGQGWFDAFILKLDSNGNFGFVTAVGAAEREFALDIAIDSQHNVYTVGTFLGTVDFDAGPGVQNRTSLGSSDIFIYKLDSNGNYVFAQTIGSTSDDAALGIAIDRQDDLFISGQFNGTVDFDTGAGIRSRTSQGNTDELILHLVQDGSFGFVVSVGGAGFDTASVIDVDSNNNIYYSGQFTGAVDFDPGAGTSEISSTGGARESFVSKLDSNGHLLYASNLPGQIVNGLAVDAIRNTYLTGSYLGTIDFDPGSGIQNRTSIGGLDIFVSKFDAAGNLIYVSSMGGDGSDDAPAGIAIDRKGNVYTTGTFTGTADFDPGPDTYNLTGAEASINSLFVSKLIGSSVNLGLSATSGSETGQTQITVTATVSAPVFGDQTVDLAVAGTGITLSDYLLTDGDAILAGTQIKILDGQTSGSVTFTVVNDSLVELNETAILTISNPSSGIQLGSTLEQQVTIADDDSAVISLSNPSIAEGGTLSFDVTISNPVDVAVTADRTTADGTATIGNSDYSALATASVQLFAAGSTTPFNVTVTTTADGDVEPDELLSLILSSLVASGRNVTFAGSGPTLTGTGSIINNDIDLALARNQASASEGQSGTTPFTFTVTRSGATNGTTTVNYAVTGTAIGNDFVGGNLPTGTVTFTPGVQTQTVTINIQADITVEPDESFTVTLGNATDSVSANTIDIVAATDSSTITNDDTAPTLDITPDGTLTSAASILFTFQFSRAMTGFNVSDISLNNGIAGTFTELDSDTYTLVVTPIIDGVVTVSVDAGIATDGGGNSNPAAAASITSDRTGPSFSTPTVFDVAENTTAIGTLAASDLHGPVTFSLSPGGDAGHFNIHPTTGVFAFITAPDFEDPSDIDENSIYSLQVIATDSLGVSTALTVNVAVTAVNESSPEFTSGAAFQIFENTTTVGTVTATDADLPVTTLTYNITGGADSSLFSISNSGLLAFKSSPDFESPADADENNVYEIEVTAADGLGLTKTQSITITVTNAAEMPQLTNVSAVTWTKVRPPTAISVLPAIVVNAPGSLSGGTLVITMNTVGSKRKSADLLKASGVSTIGSGGDVVYDSSTHQLTLQIELGEQATAAKIQSFLRGITFITKGKGLKMPTRTLHVTLTDAGNLSASVNQTIHLRKKA